MTGVISDGYGDDAERAVHQWERLLRSYARRVCADPSRYEDVLQEGRVALWQAVRAQHDYPVEVAKSRMKQVSWYPHKTPPVGSVHEGNRYEPQTTSVQAATEQFEGAEDVVASLFGLVDTIGNIEIAYHHGEIARAVASLTPKQRAYVYARFWCGMDTVAGSRSESLRLAKEMNPQVNDRSGVLWKGNKTTRGAQERLSEALEHLRGLVTA